MSVVQGRFPNHTRVVERDNTGQLNPRHVSRTPRPPGEYDHPVPRGQQLRSLEHPDQRTVQPVFPEEYLECPLRVGESLPIARAVVNKSLALAERSDFFALCEGALWGSEKETHRIRFGELLRSVVIQFLPQDQYELLLLKDVVTAQWRLNRLNDLQGRIFEAHIQEEGWDEFGLSKATSKATDFESVIAAAQASLQRALNNFLRSRQLSTKIPAGHVIANSA